MPRSQNPKVVGTVECPQKGCNETADLCQQRTGPRYLYSRKPGCGCCQQSRSKKVQQFLYDHATLHAPLDVIPRNVDTENPQVGGNPPAEPHGEPQGDNEPAGDYVPGGTQGGEDEQRLREALGEAFSE